jgi:hypothetical protein
MIQLFDIEPTTLTIDMVSMKLQGEVNRCVCEKGGAETALYVWGKPKRGQGLG